ncbi:MAG TPA: MFS transporter [Planctomycetes bacterium]|nr:MFS transporter [Planctomycetota bacterium]HIJ71798.1 MFS transporter [Planctomycetota bacterium]
MNATPAKFSSTFRWLNITQFLGALNDNVFKLLIVLFLITLQGTDVASNVTALAGAVFVVPFLLFSAFAGKLADRFSKRNIVVLAKVAEVVVMAAGCVAFLSKSILGLYTVLFLMATQSTFFAPAKYGIIPELVESDRLSRANGLLEGLTYLAIVIGMALGPVMVQLTSGRYGLMGLICVVIAATGLITSLRITPTPAAGGGKRASLLFVRDIWRTVWSIRSHPGLLLAVIGSAYFLLIGGFIYCNLIPYGITHLGLDEVQSGYLWVAGAVGIGAGALCAGKLSGRYVEFGIIPLGALGLTLSSAGLGFTRGGLYPTFALVLLMGVSAGLFIVPIHAYIQLKSPEDRRGEILAASAFLGWVGVLLASVLIYVFSSVWGISAGGVFTVLGVMTVVPTLLTIILLPDFLFRFVCVMLTRLLYRIKVVGAENVPSDEGVLLVCNHVSWVDSLLVASTQQRRIRFIIERQYYNVWWVKPICKLMRAVPISPDDPPKKIIQALRRARKAMDEGFIVCIFAEGAMTRTGMLRQFKGGLERITRGTDYKIIPAYIGGAWGSIFSYYYGKPLSTLPSKFPYPVSIHFGAGLPAGSSANQIRQKVIELSCDYFNSLKSKSRSLACHFVRSARKNWQKRCISDSTGKRLNYAQTLTSSLALARQIDKITSLQEKVGILLPPSAGAAIVNLAVTLSGKIAVNLNYTTSEQVRLDVVNQCNIKCIISSRSFIEKAKLGGETTQGLVFLEDIAAKIRPPARVAAYIKARFVPLFFLTMGRLRWGDDAATIVFSSGSTGKPKGVMLSHHNILSNIEAVRMVIRVQPRDNLCGVLPFFHSFGFNCALWFPIVNGVSVSYIANPLDGALVGKSVHQNRSTILFGPPTFLLSYIRRAQPDDFAGLRLVSAGAEKLRERVADSFEARFGIRPLEGYGATELSPVVSLNIPNEEIGGVFQVGNKPGSVGHPLPGVAVKIVDVVTGQPVEPGAEGLLMVKGPNVMLGYLNMEKETAEVLKGGWYNTGDIAMVDDDGFLTITDRLSRFSKLGGEMVPHQKVEDVYLRGLNTTERVVAVTSLPHPKKGEELVVLYLADAASPHKLHEIVTNSDLPNIWKPRPNNYIKVESMPMLGSGKPDIMKMRKIAADAKKITRD